MVSALTLGGEFLLLVDQAGPLNPLHLLRFACVCPVLAPRSPSSAITDRRGPTPGGIDMFLVCKDRGLEGFRVEVFDVRDRELSMAFLVD